jgi:RNA methyltransferase, TrmH family
MITREITSLQHSIIKHLVKIRTSREYRHLEKSALITGIKAVKEIASLFPLRTLLIGKGATIPKEIKAEKTFFVTESILKKVTGLENPEPLAAEVPIPLQAELNHKNFLLVLDGVSDPGNLGTLLRTALALGWDGAFITSDSTDPFNEKALRAAKGATFRLPLRIGSWQELSTLIQKNKMHVYVADVKGERLVTKKIHTPIVLVLGNESHGATLTAKENYTSITIPMNENAESLNVAIAGAILMYTIKGSYDEIR